MRDWEMPRDLEDPQARGMSLGCSTQRLQETLTESGKSAHVLVDVLLARHDCRPAELHAHLRRRVVHHWELAPLLLPLPLSLKASAPALLLHVPECLVLLLRVLRRVHIGLVLQVRRGSVGRAREALIPGVRAHHALLPLRL